MPDAQKTDLLRMIPSVDQLLRVDELATLRASIGVKRLTAIARLVTSQMRSTLLADLETKDLKKNNHTAETLLAEGVRRTIEASSVERSAGIRHVINATGVVLHTNLGRAPLSDAACDAISKSAARYCTLEYDSLAGSRGIRGARVEALLQQLTGAEDALVVNNCAAAALLILSVLASDGETIVSRGELVEIGGDFRVPDVMAASGTRMIEVGTTNRTHLGDYQKAINDCTRLIMRVHPSNYRIVGFASSPSLAELAAFAHDVSLPLYEDAGSGQISDLSKYGLDDGPSVSTLLQAGVDVISFSGDKLLGSAQAGLIVGRKAIVERLRRHPLYRALRSDKLRLAALEATLEAHQKDSATEEIPTLRMLATPKAQILQRAQLVVDKVTERGTALNMELLSANSTVGGGAAPTSTLPTTVLAISHADYSPQEIERRLRALATPIICRIAEAKVLLDLRTVFIDEEPLVIEGLLSL